MTIKELTKTISKNVDILICDNYGNTFNYCPDNLLQATAYGDFIVDKLIVLKNDKIEITIKMQPLKKEG